MVEYNKIINEDHLCCLRLLGLRYAQFAFCIPKVESKSIRYTSQGPKCAKTVDLEYNLEVSRNVLVIFTKTCIDDM